jgi:acyl-coenzyme A thioesterase PaaI-like protein
MTSTGEMRGEEAASTLARGAAASRDGVAGTRSHLLSELRFAVRRSGDELHGSAEVLPEMAVPGTPHFRTSVLAMWADTLAGLLAAGTIAPRVPVTLDLDVNLFAPAPAGGTVLATGRTMKSGRSVFVAGVEFTTSDGASIASASAAFMPAPDPNVRLPDELSIDAPPTATALSMPLAERAGCERRRAGVAVLPRSDDGLNSSRTLNGGLLGLVAEEAALSLSPGQTLCSLALRYLHPVRVGPAVATAHVDGGVGRVQIRDAGNADRLAVFASTRTFGSISGE